MTKWQAQRGALAVWLFVAVVASVVDVLRERHASFPMPVFAVLLVAAAFVAIALPTTIVVRFLTTANQVVWLHACVVVLIAMTTWFMNG